MTDLKTSISEFKTLSDKMDDVVTGGETSDVMVNGKVVPSIRKQVKTQFDQALPEVNTIAKSRAKVATNAAKQAEDSARVAKAEIGAHKNEMADDQADREEKKALGAVNALGAVIAAKSAEIDQKDVEVRHADVVEKHDDVVSRHAAINTTAQRTDGLARQAKDTADAAQKFNSETKVKATDAIQQAGEHKEQAKLHDLMSRFQTSAAVVSAQIAEGNNVAAHKALTATRDAAGDAFKYLQQTLTAASSAAKDKSDSELIKTTCEQLLSAMQVVETTVTSMRAEVAIARDTAQGHANTAAQITTAGLDAALLPAPAKSPIASANGRFPSEWVEQAAVFVPNAVMSMRNSLAQLKREEDFKAAMKEFEKMTIQFQSLSSKVASGGSNNGGPGFNEEWFEGVHQQGKSHALPVFNQLEQAQVAEASQEEGFAEVMRQMGGSGVFGMRQYTADSTFDPRLRVFDAAYSALNIHNHPNYDGMPGMAEFTAIVNGYYVRTRHNDYKTMFPQQGDYLERKRLYAPSIPASVATLSTGVDPTDGSVDTVSNTQAKYMKEVFERNPQDCEWQLAYLEVWLEEITDYNKFTDPADSFRHSNESDNLREIFNKGRAYNYSGHKNRLENLSYQPVTIRYVDEYGRPHHAVVRYRISTYPVGNLAPINAANQPAPRIVVGVAASHAHTVNVQLTKQQADNLRSATVSKVTLKTTEDFGHSHAIDVTWNGSNFVGTDTHSGHQHPIKVLEDTAGNIPFNRDKALNGIIDNNNRFKLIRDLRGKKKHAGFGGLIDSRSARFECVDLEALCNKLPGLDGEGAVLTEQYTEYGLNDQLQDATGQQLNAAYYNRTYQFAEKDASGRQTAHRGFNDPTLFVAKTSKTDVLGGFSWMIPIELLLRSPRENWNPLNLPTGDYSSLKTEEASGRGKVSENPYSGIHEQHFNFGIPAALFNADGSGNDAADTATNAYVKDGLDVSHHVYAKGIWVFTPDGQRTRFPIYPLFHDFNYAAAQQHLFKDELKSILTKVLDGTLTQTELDNYF